MDKMDKKPKYVDVLDVDKSISGQNFCCVSFLSPEKILKDKNEFLFEQFLQTYDFTKSMEKFSQFVNFLSFKYKLNAEVVMKDYEDFVEEEKQLIKSTPITDEYKGFIDKNEEELEKEFNIQHNFQTSVRSVKIRGSYSTQEEAELRAKLLRETDDSIDIFVGPVGTWLLWEPDAYKTAKVEHMEEELNKLMHQKIDNEKNAKAIFDQRIKETKKRAIEENIKNAEKSGNVLTQNIDNDGNLVGINSTSQEKTFMQNNGGGPIDIDYIRKELFEGDGIVIDKKGDKGLSKLVNNPFT